MRPNPRLRMPGNARRVSRTALRNIDSNCLLHTESGVSAADPGGGPPVLSTRISVCRSGAARPSIAAESPRSQALAVMLPRPGGVPATSSFKRSRLRATATTSAPSAAKADAIARPSPREAPVTSARRFSSPKSIVQAERSPSRECSRRVLSDQGSQSLSAGSRGGLRRSAQQFLRVGGRQCAAEQKALRLVAVVLLQEQELREALDALRGDADPHGSRHRNDGGGDRPVVAAVDQTGHERSVDLQ